MMARAWLPGAENCSDCGSYEAGETCVAHTPKDLKDPIQEATSKVLAMLEEANRLAVEHPEGFDLELLFDMAKYFRDRRVD